MKDSKFVIIWSKRPVNSELELLYATPLICQFIIDNIVVICVTITICNVGTVNSLLLLFEILGLNSFNKCRGCIKCESYEAPKARYINFHSIIFIYTRPFNCKESTYHCSTNYTLNISLHDYSQTVFA